MEKQKNGRRMPGYAAAAGLVFGCTTGTLAHAQDWKETGTFSWQAVGKTHQLGKGHAYWLGEFAGTFMNDKGRDSRLNETGWRCPGFNDFNLNDNKGKAAGHCIVADRGGDQAYVTWQCEGDTQDCNGTFDFTEGTGKYQAISGHNTFTAISW
jgi:hypothetical protein